MEEKKLVDLAINWVCPNTGFPNTPIVYCVDKGTSNTALVDATQKESQK